jgi:hypothetical protein
MVFEEGASHPTLKKMVGEKDLDITGTEDDD